jgi:regulator of protease activity HflC (stomatin/prohibitin superfamily)
MAAESVKYMVFVLLIVFVISLFFVLLSNLDFFMQNILGIAILLAFLLALWKWDFMLLLKDYERAVIMRFGKVNRVGGPGWTILIPGIEDPTVVDLRTKTIDVPKQDVITKDNIELHVDAVIYLRVNGNKECVINSVIEVEDYTDAIKLYIISGIRDTIGSMELPEVIANTNTIAKNLRQQAANISKDWGIEIVSVELKEVDIPPTVIEAMHDEKAAVQRKLARMESAQAHMAEIEAVKTAAADLSDKALAYYYIRALEKLGQGKSTKFIFPMELSKLAQAVGGKVSGQQGPEVEQLFKKYAPVVTAMLSKSEKQKIAKQTKKKKK